MKQWFLVTLALMLTLAGTDQASAESTLEKISRTGTLTIGTRTGSPPFAYINKNNEWVGFSIDLVEKAIAPVISRKLGKPIKVKKKESTPQTRIPLLTSNAVDLIAETMTDTRSRRKSVDFSLTFFVTGAQFLVKKGSPIKGIKSIAGRRIAAQQGSTNARIIREQVPSARLREFPDQPAAFQALEQVTNIKLTLTNFELHSASIGEDAQGEVTVTVEHDGQSYRGRGASVDIVEAGSRACLDVMNRLLRKSLRGGSSIKDPDINRASI